MRAPYDGEPFKLMVTEKASGKRVIAFWTRKPEADALRQFREHEDKPRWSDPRYLHVINRKTGDE